MLDTNDPTRIMLRGVAYVPLFYAIVQLERWIAGEPFEWFGLPQFFIAIFLPLLVTIGTLIRHRQSLERSSR